MAMVTSGYFERATICCAASPIESAVVKLSPLAASIALPCSTLVPSMRMTIGTFTDEVLDRGDQALGQHVAAQDAAEDVDQDALDVLVRHQDAEGVLDLLGVGAAADVEEVGRLAAGQLDDVHRRHGQAGAVDHAADRAVEADVVQRELRRLDLERILFVGVAQRREVLVPEHRVVVEGHLRVEREQVALLGDDQRVDLDERGVAADERAVERLQQLDRLADLRRLRGRGRRRSCAPGSRCRPMPGSTYSLRIRCGVFSATSSMSMPPAELAMSTGALRGAIDEHAEVELADDLPALPRRAPATPSARPGRSGG